MVFTSNREQQTRSIKRTICIGLGGTGRDILMRIRRLIIDRYGKLSELPIVSFVHIDADKGASKLSGLRTGNIYHGEDILFRDSERVVATMNSKEVNDLAQGLERRLDFEREGPFAHIGSWFSPQLLKNVKAIEEGASGIRPVGRLAFFHNYRKIHRVIETAENRTIGHEKKLLEKGFIVEPGLSLFVVGSLCGGTGSGMFLDVAYSLRRMYGEQENQLVGYLVMSPELYGNTPSMNASTYAALKELNHYASESTKFEARYDPQHLIDISETRPPFDFVYLISNRTADNYKILEKSKLCNIIAHKIFLDFADELSPVVQGQKNNFLEKLTRTDEHPRRNVQRYLTFGLSKVYFPRDLTVQVSLNRIRLKLLSFWLEGEGQNPDTQALLDRFLLNWRCDRAKGNIFTAKLEEATVDKNKTFHKTLNSWKNGVEQQISTCQNPGDRQRLMQQLPGDFRTQFRKVQPGETESTRGMWLTILQQTNPQIAKNFRQEIEQFLGELLNPVNEDFSLRSTRAWLEALLTEITKYQRDIEENIQSLNNPFDSDDIDKKWQDVRQIIEDNEKKRGLLPFNDRRNSQFQEEAQRVLQEVYRLIQHNFDYALYQEALTIVKGLHQRVQSLATSARNFDSLLKNLQVDYEKRGDDLEHLNEDEMNGEAIFTDEDTDECYQILLAEGDRRSQLVAVSNRITEQAGIGESLINFLIQERLIDEKQLQESLDETVESSFGSRSLSVVQSVIRRFLQKYPFSNGETRLAQILREADPLLPLHTSAPFFYNEPGKSSQIIGFKDTDERESKQFRELLTGNLGVSDTILKPIQAEDEIVIVNEYAAFPLRLIGGLEHMREQYSRQQQYEAALLHTESSNGFIDIIPPDARKMEELQDIFFACLAFGLLKENPVNKKYEFQYYDELRNCYETAELSYIWNEALEALATLREMTQAVRELRDQAIDKIKTQPSSWNDFYYPKLREFVAEVDDLPEDNPNYPEKAIVVGTRATLDTSAKEGIIVRIMRHVQEEVLKQPQQSRIQPNTLPSQSLPSTPNGMSSNHNGHTFRNDVKGNNYLEVETVPTPSQSTLLPSQDAMKRLKDLVEMRKAGYLTEEQFEAAKKQILGL